MICSERKFLIKNDENSFSIIYDKIINEYKIISSSNFSFPTNIRHLESKENSIDFTDEIYSNSISKELYRESETTSEFSESNKVIDTNTNSENKLPDSNGITSDENESDNTNERIENSSDIKILEDENIQTTETSNSHTYEISLSHQLLHLRIVSHLHNSVNLILSYLICIQQILKNLIRIIHIRRNVVSLSNHSPRILFKLCHKI